MSSALLATGLILLLPTELLENVLVLSTRSGSPSAIGAFAQTCKTFHDLIYKAADQHLWRRCFLEIFDDPRVANGELEWATSPAAPSPVTPLEFDWRSEFIDRMMARNFFHDYHDWHPGSKALTTTSLLPIFKTLLSTLASSLPFPRPPSFMDFDTPRVPAFPPFVLLLATGQLHDTRKGKNTQWVQTLLQRGYPLLLTRKLLRLPVDGDEDKPSEDHTFDEISRTGWESGEVAQAFYKLVFQTGYIPYNQPEAEPQETQVACPTLRKQRFYRTSAVPELDGQLLLARSEARRKVYNLSYLRPERHFGPFVGAEVGEENDVDGPENGHWSVRATRVLFHAEDDHHVHLHHHHHSGEDEDDEDDGDYEVMFEELGEGDDEHEGVGEGAEEGGDDDDELETVAFEDIFPLIGRPPSNGTSPPIPEPHLLVPDYVWLASARIILQSNLRDLLSQPMDEPDAGLNGVMQALSSLECVRMGGAPAFYARKEQDVEGEEVATSSPDDAEDKVEGWDWAGVTGDWRRCICWLDYRDLLISNLHDLFRRFADTSIEETIRIFPMALRVSGYSKPPIPSGDISKVSPLVWKLPIIHIEGEGRGSDSDDGSKRRIRGTVSMVADGSVRWSLTSSQEGSEAPEWLTEGVHIGGLGSSSGVVGMWTGAEHERTDPLGPFWAWKVGKSSEDFLPST